MYVRTVNNPCELFSNVLFLIILNKDILLYCTICAVFYSLNFIRPVQNVHLLPQYTPNYDVEQSDIPSGLLLMEYRDGMFHLISQFPIGRSLEGLNREIEAETP